jgi:hypothetical protein
MAMKNGSCSVTTLNGRAALPFVISTGAQRSGEICGSPPATEPHPRTLTGTPHKTREHPAESTRTHV